jgi:hypothetical protein
MEQRKRLKGELERDRRLGRAAWLRYLATGALLAVTRVALFLLLVHRSIFHISAETGSFVLDWLLPEAIAVYFWSGVMHIDGKTTYYLAWGLLMTLGSFMVATPTLFVGWLRQRHFIVQTALCALIIPAVSGLLWVIVVFLGLATWPWSHYGS